jgi:hypothetical protein
MRFTPPTYTAFPQECSFCSMCGKLLTREMCSFDHISPNLTPLPSPPTGHNATSHDAFMKAFPSIACSQTQCWPVGESKIHHGCLWCRDYRTVYKALNRPRPRKNNLGPSVAEDAHVTKKQRSA